MLDSYIVAGWLILAWPAFWLWIGSKLGSRNFATMATISVVSLTGFTVGMTMLANLIPQALKVQLTQIGTTPVGPVFVAQAFTGYTFWHYLVLSIPWAILAFVVARLILGLYVLKIRIRGFEKIENHTQRRFDKIAKLIGITPVKVYVGTTMPVAFSDNTGVYVGNPIISDLPKNDVDAIIAHEYSHIKRRDVPSRWLWLLMTSIAFVMPSKTLTRSYLLEVEKNADRQAVSVLGSPIPLAQALVSVARLSTSVAVNFGGSDVTQRALALLEPSAPKPHHLDSRLRAVAMAFCLTLLLPIFTWPHPVNPTLPGISEADMHKLVAGKALAIATKPNNQTKQVQFKIYSDDAIKQLPDGRLIIDRSHIIGTL